MRAAIVVFPGSNREQDARAALRRTLGVEPEMVWHRERELPPTDLVVLPGGFSYGDYLRPGAVAARSPIMRSVVERARAGVPTMGICNGFQILTECGLLPGALMRNASLRFACRFVTLRIETTASRFTSGYDRHQLIRVPVAHHDGNFFADDATLDRLEDEDRVAFRYATAEGYILAEASPNGSRRGIAGILGETRTVIGLMPHPENATDPALGGTDGCAMFRALAEVAA